MNKFKLNEKEKLVEKVEGNPSLVKMKNSVIFLLLAVLTMIGSVFFFYIAKSEKVEMYNIIGIVFLLGGIGLLLYHVYNVSQAKKLKGSVSYYITSSRLVVVDKDDVVVKELLLSRIKKIDTELVKRNAGYLYINPKIDNSQKGRNKSRSTGNTVYTKDTIILEGISNISKIKELLSK